MYAADTTCKAYAPDAAADRLNARAKQMMLPAAQPRVSVAPMSADAARLRQLEAAIAAADERARRFRTPQEETEMLMMRRPFTTERAYALFGLLLGTLPPAAIVLRFAWLCFRGDEGAAAIIYLGLGLLMIMICSLMGEFMGRKLASMIDRAERRHWTVMSFTSLLAGFIWACVTGATGGAIVFIIGALFGLVCALPFGLAGFLLFTICHRLLARGGMMDARHFWPVACGIALAGAALVLSPALLPY
jgi:hypothetical protein